MAQTRFSPAPVAVALLAAVPGVSGMAQAETTVIIARSDCAALVRHAPAPDVAYTPGVDVNGRPVVPADLHARPQVDLPETVEIPITVELAERYGIPATSDLYKPEAIIGRARVRLSDGRAWFNERPLSGEEEQAISRLCRGIIVPGRR